MTIYLYVKTHNKTGLKYLGKTIEKDPHSYKGSGVEWKSHLAEHGADYTTTIIKECSNTLELSQWGRYYSQLWNIVESKEWANRIPETGGGPGAAKGSKNHIGSNNPMFGKSHSDQVKHASSLRRSLTNSKRRWYNDGHCNCFLKECPEGWKLGRINQKPTTAGNKWYNNGTIAICSKEKPTGNDWVPGMLKKSQT
jgi:hypothetical protein